MRRLSRVEWERRAKEHERVMAPLADAFLARRTLGKKHPVHDFLFTYYPFSPTKLKQWVPSFEEALEAEDFFEFSPYWLMQSEGFLRLNPSSLQGMALNLTIFIEDLCKSILERTPRFGCFGLHEWAMVYRLPVDSLRHAGHLLRLSPEEIARFVESQNLCCTHYDAYRFFTPEAKPLNGSTPTLDQRLQNEQGGCLHANMDLYKWATKLWPWIGSDFIAKTFLLTVEGRELDMRASPYDLGGHGFVPICIETEEGRKEYVRLQQQLAQKSIGLRQELAAFCARFRAWQESLGLEAKSKLGLVFM